MKSYHKPCMRYSLTSHFKPRQELFEGYEELDVIPFGLKMEEYLNYATMQFSKRFQRIQRAREQTVEQLYQIDEEE